MRVYFDFSAEELVQKMTEVNFSGDVLAEAVRKYHCIYSKGDAGHRYKIVLENA